MTSRLLHLEPGDTRVAFWGAAGVIAITSLVWWLSWAIERRTYDLWGGTLVAVALFVVSIPALRWLAHREPDRRIAKIACVALVLKLCGSLVRYAITFGVYDGVADAGFYHNAGAVLAESFRSGVFVVEVERGVVGTGFVSILTGIIYTFTGATKIGGFLTFSWLGFWGLYLFYRAFCLGCPDGDRRRYAYLVFLLPSLLFWSSSIGKEAWMTLSLGLVAYGAARLLRVLPGGFPVVGVGLVATALVRPHMTLVVVGALLVGYVLRRAPPSASLLRPVLKVAGLAVLVGAAVLAMTQAQRFLKVETLNPVTLESVLERTGEQTEQGGSAFEAEPVRSPLELPGAVLAVLFRPFPTEADNALSLVASIEGTLLLALFLASWRRVLRAPLLMLKHAYVAFACTYALLFIVAFSNINNFGIIVRQRVQLLPFALVVLALPLATKDQETLPEASGEEPSWARTGVGR
ncbi:MAG TPA: hypothetical protein VGR26_01815 [Acidimicrobiales bacterium]|nr:hypothetical protein [Acidimicrobiales bacterium]